MTYFEYDGKLKTLRYLVERRNTGTPQQLAKRLRVSERTVLRMVQQLRGHGHAIIYNCYQCTYELRGLKKFLRKIPAAILWQWG